MSDTNRRESTQIEAIILPRCGCGGEAEIYHWESDISVGCAECDMETGWQVTEQKAIAIWTAAMGGKK